MRERYWIMSNDKLREAAVTALIALRKMAKEESTPVRLEIGIDATIALNAALADSADARTALRTDCVDCGRNYGDEYGFPDLVLPNDTWAAISPTGDEGGMLCPSCICKRLVDRGFEDVPAVFRSGPCCVYPKEKNENV